MRIGGFTRIFDRPSFEEVLDAAAGHGLQALQLNLESLGLPPMPDRLDPDLCRRVRDEAAARGLTLDAVSGTFNTADIVKELGISYTADYYHDDQPTLVRTKHGPLPCVPYSMEINDAQVYRWQTEGAEFARMIRDAFDTLYEEGAETGRVLAICLHPFLYGQPHRLKYLDEALAYVMSHEGVWQATGSEIADWAMREWLPSWALPVEDMPGAGA